MYVMICTVPDLAYVVSAVSRFMSNPRRQTLGSDKVLRCLRGTTD